MEKFSGKAIFKGVAVGKIVFGAKDKQQVRRTKIEDASAETQRFEEAKERALKELGSLYEKALKEVGEDNAAIFEVHSMLLEDEDFNDAIKDKIVNQQVNAEYAVAKTGDDYSEMFANMEDEYFRARATDIKDISERVISQLTGGTGLSALSEPSIIVAEDLAPSETIQLDKDKLLAFVTEFGSANSHTAILARTMNLPALIGVKIDKSWNGKTGIVDGYNGTVIIDPDNETIEEYKKIQQKDKEKRELLKSLKGKKTVSKSGKTVHLYANIGKPSDLGSVIENDAEGIGLFRSEFLYLDSKDFPTEEEQFSAYKKVAETMAGKKVIIRTLDLGADKQVDYFNLGQEDNPAMGYRAIRICLDRQDIFKTQLRALLRASAFGNISIMYPMIISVDEVRQIKEIISGVMDDLRAEGVKFKENIEQGIMIETPAAVIMSYELAKEVDFFSIGTNDLTQYTLAIDRQNSKLDNINDSHHPAVLRSIKTVVENAHKAGIWAGICGELGADTSLTKTFLEYGVDELSVSPSFVLPVRKAVTEAD
ncbi:MAG: phosphoenolpyruvate--protein phosphotransferase [Clostridiales bacterium]|nr:phosphoenolpyruvate--protein phosphotransferase [Clostridiales bacterium]